MLSLGGRLHMATSQDRFWNRKSSGFRRQQVGAAPEPNADAAGSLTTKGGTEPMPYDPFYPTRSRLGTTTTTAHHASTATSVRPGIARGSGVGDQGRIVCSRHRGDTGRRLLRAEQYQRKPCDNRAARANRAARSGLAADRRQRHDAASQHTAGDDDGRSAGTAANLAVGHEPPARGRRLEIKAIEDATSAADASSAAFFNPQKDQPNILFSSPPG